MYTQNLSINDLKIKIIIKSIGILQWHLYRLAFRPLIPDGIWKRWFSRRKENRRTWRKTLTARTRTTNSTHIIIRHRDLELNPGHKGGRRVLSPLSHLCSSKRTFIVTILLLIIYNETMVHNFYKQVLCEGTECSKQTRCFTT